MAPLNFDLKDDAPAAAEPATASDTEGFSLTVRRRRIQCLVGLKQWAAVLEAAAAFPYQAAYLPVNRLALDGTVHDW